MTQPQPRRKRVPFNSEDFEKMMDEVFALPAFSTNAPVDLPSADPIERLRQAAQKLTPNPIVGQS